MLKLQSPPNGWVAFLENIVVDPAGDWNITINNSVDKASEGVRNHTRLYQPIDEKSGARTIVLYNFGTEVSLVGVMNWIKPYGMIPVSPRAVLAIAMKFGDGFPMEMTGNNLSTVTIVSPQSLNGVYFHVYWQDMRSGADALSDDILMGWPSNCWFAFEQSS